jgi:translation initiation factor IF-3
MFRDRQPPRERGPRINERIGVREVRVVTDDGEQLGVLPTRDALAKAKELGLDLVEVAPTSRPPVCRIMDYGRYKYELSKKTKQARKKQHQVKVKEIKMRPKIETHDYEFKKKHIVEFLAEGEKVKVTLQFRGREMAHTDLGRKILDRLAKELEDLAKVESSPRQEGRIMVMMLMPHVTKKSAKAQETSDRKKVASKKAEAKSADAESSDSSSSDSKDESPVAKG